MRKPALVLLLLPLALAAETLELGGNRVTVAGPSGWHFFQEAQDDYYYVWATDDEELLAVINIYAGEDLEMSTAEVLEQFDNNPGDMLREMLSSLINAIETNSGPYDLRFGDYESLGDKPAFHVTKEYYDTWDGIDYYNLDTMFLHNGRIIYMDAFCLLEHRGAFKGAVLRFIEGMRFH